MQIKQDQRDKIAERICMEADASESAKSGLLERWKEARGVYNNEEDVSTLNVVDGLKPYPLPAYRSKADRISDAVVKSFTSIWPFVQVIVPTDEGETNADNHERALMCLAEHSRFKRSFRRGVIEALNTDMGFLRVRPLVEDGRVVGIDSERIKPELMIGYPLFKSSWDDVTTIGHRFYKELREIKNLIKSEVYFDEELVTTTAQELVDINVYSPLTNVDQTVPIEDENDLSPVKLYEVITEEKINGEWKKVICVVAADTRKLLSIQEYPYPIHWYVSMRIDDEDDTLWANNSLAQRAKGLNMAISDGYSSLFLGSLATAFPILTVDGTITGVKNKKWQPGMILELPHGVKANILASAFNPGALPIALAKIEEMLDAVMGINRLGTGQGLPSETREAAINGLLQSQQDSKEGYADAIAPSVARYFQLLDLFLIQHFWQFKEIYGEKIPLASPEEIPVTYRLEVTGQNTSSSPQMLMQKLQMLLQLAMQPQSNFSYQKVEERVGQAMDLPFDINGLRKEQIDELLNMIALMEQNGIPATQIAGQALQGVIQQINEAQQNAQPNGPGLPAGANDLGGAPQETA